MAEKNNVTIELLRRPKYFADAFNQFLYCGEQRIDPEHLIDMDTRELYVEDKTGNLPMTMEKFRDILKCAAIKTDENRDRH